MSSIKSQAASVAVAIIFMAFCVPACAAPPASEVLLPATTKGYVSVSNVPELIESFDATQWGRLLSDPRAKPLLDN